MVAFQGSSATKIIRPQAKIDNFAFNNSNIINNEQVLYRPLVLIINIIDVLSWL